MEVRNVGRNSVILVLVGTGLACDVDEGRPAPAVPKLYADVFAEPAVGAPCRSDDDCAYEGGFCLTHGDGFLAGMCSAGCDPASACPASDGAPPAVCVDAADLGLSGQGICLSACDEQFGETRCRGGYGCASFSEGAVCAPASRLSCGQLGGAACEWNGNGACDGLGPSTNDCDQCCGGSVDTRHLSCGDLGGTLCEWNGNGACGGEGPPTYDCDHCCGVPEAPSTGSCYGDLTALGAVFERTVGPSEVVGGYHCGVEDAVYLSSVDGIDFRYEHAGTAYPILVGCDAALAIARMLHLEELASVERVIHLGTYVCKGIPGSSDVSQHGLGRAIDISGFDLDDGRTLRLRNDWDGPWLRAAADAMAEHDVWNIILTPDYDAAHWDHFHLDLKPGADFYR